MSRAIWCALQYQISRCQSIDAVVGNRYCFIDGLVGHYSRDRSKDFFAGDPHPIVHAGEQSRLQVGAMVESIWSAAAQCQPRAFLFGDVDIRKNTLLLVPANDRPHCSRRVKRIADGKGGFGPGHEALDELVMDAGIDQEARPGTAHLAIMLTLTIIRG
jgi:hypothetical protein